MSSGARVRTYYAPQTDKEVVPDSGWKTLPVVTNGLTASHTLTESQISTESRIKEAGMLTDIEVAGDINTEFMFGVFDDFMAAAFWNNWVDNGDGTQDLTVSDTRKFFAVTKDFKDININYLFTGVHVNSMSINIKLDGLIEITFGLMGLGYQSNKTVSFAVSPEPATSGKKASRLSIGDILSDGNPIGVCIESFTFEINNQAEIQKCLGNKLYGGNILALIANITGTMTLAFSPKAYDILELQRTGATTSIEVPIEFSDTQKYIISLPQVQVSGDIPSPSPTDIVTAEVTFSEVEQSPIITRVG